MSNQIVIATRADAFPDLTEAEVDAILAQTPTFEAQADEDEYNWGWIAWEIGIDVCHMDGLALMGWLDAEDAYGEERAAERQMFAQLVNGY